MGMMSKAKVVRLPERPKPPSWEDITEDISGATDNDAVFNIGKSCLPTIVDSPGSGSTDEQTSSADTEAAQASYDAVLHLIQSHDYLSTASSSLRAQYSDLQSMGQSLQGSINELKRLAKEVTLESQGHGKATPKAEGEVKSKSKQKKKK